MLWSIAVVLLVLWLGGFMLDVAGGLVHLLLLAAIAVVVLNVVKGATHRAT